MLFTLFAYPNTPKISDMVGDNMNNRTNKVFD